MNRLAIAAKISIIDNIVMWGSLVLAGLIPSMAKIFVGIFVLSIYFTVALLLFSGFKTFSLLGRATKATVKAIPLFPLDWFVGIIVFCIVLSYYIYLPAIPINRRYKREFG